METKQENVVVTDEIAAKVCADLEYNEMDNYTYRRLKLYDDFILKMDDTQRKFCELVRDKLFFLTDKQRSRYIKYVQGESYREIAKGEGLSSHKIISESIGYARKNLLKYIKESNVVVAI